MRVLVEVGGTWEWWKVLWCSWGKTHYISAKPTAPKPSINYHPPAPTSAIMKCIKLLVMTHIYSSLSGSLDLLRFTHHLNRSTADASPWPKIYSWNFWINKDTYIRLFIDYSSTRFRNSFFSTDQATGHTSHGYSLIVHLNLMWPLHSFSGTVILWHYSTLVLFTFCNACEWLGWNRIVCYDWTACKQGFYTVSYNMQL